MSVSYHLQNGRIIDPATGRDEIADLFIADGTIVASSAELSPDAETINASGLVVVPGLIDLHVHFREPGKEEAETIATGAAAAARGGFTTVVTMPNTTPPVDDDARVTEQIDQAEKAGLVRMLPSGCITQGRAGTMLADLQAMKEAGVVAFTDDGNTVADDALMKEAMKAAAALGRPIMDHAQDPKLAAEGVMITGARAEALGLPGMPPESEIAAVRRDIELCRRTNCRTHLQHLSTAGAVALVRKAKEEGLPISAEATPHHLYFADDDIPADNANFKMNPPLGSAGDRDALVAGVVDGTIEVLATDHAPHTAESKAQGFLKAPFGIIGLETAVGITYAALVTSGRLALADWLDRWTIAPARILGLPSPSLQSEQPADITVLDLATSWTVKADHFVSKSRNTPFEGLNVVGRPAYTFCNGKKTWDGQH